MIANLPLLFANGNPQDLSKISAADLEKFITFMVTCSWGHDTAKVIKQPPWWPKNVAFSHPFIRPCKIPQDWEARLKQLVKRCYDYHKSAFLLLFSAHLARYDRKILTYVDNNDHTTSLYHGPTGRLLVTFRNENLIYDKSSDIYLCDTCDSHFDNVDNLKAHERLCNNSYQSSGSCTGSLQEFISALKLKPIQEDEKKIPENCVSDPKPRNGRNAANIDRGPPYPFSSLAYLKNAKINVQRDTSYSRERIERYCLTSTVLSKNISSKGKHVFPVRYKRPIDYWHRKHLFPNQRCKPVLDLKGQLLLLKCKPISVNITRMSLEDIEEYIDNLRKEALSKQLTEEKDIVYVEPDIESMDVDVKSCDPLKKTDSECEVIDLCSDDEETSVNENCDPRAGIACVMRGGAILRRTAATPHVLPAEPCGARQRHLNSLVLQPHPVILITRSLNSLQTIALE